MSIMFRKLVANSLYVNGINTRLFTCVNKNARTLLNLSPDVKSTNFDNKLGNILKKWKKIFIENGVDEPDNSIENIAAFTLNTRKIVEVYENENKIMTCEDVDKIAKMCELRLKHVPIQYIIGEWDFRNLTLKMRPPVFIPRPETEQIVDLVLTECNQNVDEILELCCGSGAISLALLKVNPEFKIVAIDKSEEACKLTKENAILNKLEDRITIIKQNISEENVGNFLNKKFKIIVSNPPYVPLGDMEKLQTEILQYEDRDALDGGVDGLRLIKLVLQISSHLLENDGKTILEVDRSHPKLLRDYLALNPSLRLAITGVHNDIFKNDRFVTVKKTI